MYGGLTALFLHQGPIWSKVKSITILLISTVLLALVAELVVQNVEILVRNSNISETAIGLVLVVSDTRVYIEYSGVLFFITLFGCHPLQCVDVRKPMVDCGFRCWPVLPAG